MTSLILYAVDYSQSNIDFDAAPLRQINVVKLYMFTKYCVLNKREKIGVTIFMHYTDITIFVLEHITVTHAVAAVVECVVVCLCQLAVPVTANDEDLRHVAAFRSRGRLPVCCILCIFYLLLFFTNLFSC